MVQFGGSVGSVTLVRERDGSVESISTGTIPVKTRILKRPPRRRPPRRIRDPETGRMVRETDKVLQARARLNRAQAQAEREGRPIPTKLSEIDEDRRAGQVSSEPSAPSPPTSQSVRQRTIQRLKRKQQEARQKEAATRLNEMVRPDRPSRFQAEIKRLTGPQLVFEQLVGSKITAAKRLAQPFVKFGKDITGLVREARTTPRTGTISGDALVSAGIGLRTLKAQATLGISAVGAPAAAITTGFKSFLEKTQPVSTQKVTRTPEFKEIVTAGVERARSRSSAPSRFVASIFDDVLGLSGREVARGIREEAAARQLSLQETQQVVRAGRRELVERKATATVGVIGAEATGEFIGRFLTASKAAGVTVKEFARKGSFIQRVGFGVKTFGPSIAVAGTAEGSAAVQVASAVRGEQASPSSIFRGAAFGAGFAGTVGGTIAGLRLTGTRTGRALSTGLETAVNILDPGEKAGDILVDVAVKSSVPVPVSFVVPSKRPGVDVLVVTTDVRVAAEAAERAPFKVVKPIKVNEVSTTQQSTTTRPVEVGEFKVVDTIAIKEKTISPVRTNVIAPGGNQFLDFSKRKTSRSIIGTKTDTKSLTKTESIAQTTVSTLTLVKTNTLATTKTTTKTTLPTKTTTTSLSTSTTIPTFTSVPTAIKILTNVPTSPFVVGSFPVGLAGIRKSRFRQAKRFTPGITSVALDIRATPRQAKSLKRKGRRFTGLELRPVIQRKKGRDLNLLDLKGRNKTTRFQRTLRL